MKPIVKIVKAVVPAQWIKHAKLQRVVKSVMQDYIYDFRRFMKFSAAYDMTEKEHFKAYLIKEYHAIEKGLALPAPKPGFGYIRNIRLVDTLNTYIDKYGEDEVTRTTVHALEEYLDFSAKNAVPENDLTQKILHIIARHKTLENASKNGGTKLINKGIIQSAIDFDFNKFMSTRFSTRDFSDEPVDRKTVLDAIQTAAFTPSVCNRQAWKVYVIDHTKKELQEKYLQVQNGNKGFGERISCLLIITGKLSSFFSYERNQVYIDGGMYAMSLVLALHAQGLGTCCLNTSYTSQRTEEFLNIGKVDEDAVPIMFLAVGNLKDSYKVAVSARKPLSELVQILE